MSFCRWSTDDYLCDLYIYADVNGGYTIHVGSHRPVYKQPLPEPIEPNAETIDAYMERRAVVMRMLDEAEWVPIGLPFDSETFREDTGAAAADRVRDLLAMGYRCPDHVERLLREDGDDA